MNKLILIILSVIAESLAIIIFFSSHNYFLSIIYFFFFHAISASLLSLAMYLALSGKFGKNLFHNMIVFSTFFFFLLMMEYIAFLFFLYLFENQKADQLQFLSIDPNRELGFKIFSLYSRQYGEGSIISRLNDPNTPAVLKQASLLYLIDKAPTLSYNFVRGSMGNPSDEIRLLAFSFMSKKENEINKKIFIFKKYLEEKNRKDLGEPCFELAQLYWNMVYMGISDKDFENYNLNISKDYIIKALNEKYRYYDSMFLLGRISVKLKDYNNAEEYFRQALISDAIRSRIIPYLAEIYYMMGDYKKTKELFKKTSYNIVTNNRLENIVKLWGAS